MKVVLFILLLIASDLGLAQGKYLPVQLDVEIPPIICPISHEVSDHYVPPSNRRLYKNTNTQINVSYEGTITEKARAAFENGVLPYIAENFKTDIPIGILVRFTQLEDGILAGASTTSWYSNFPNIPNPNQVYPVALAEKIARINLNGDDPEISISINSAVDWYYDFDNPTGVGSRFDFVSVLLHEVFHGLGFIAGVVEDPNSNLLVYNIFTEERHSIYASKMHNGLTPIPDIPDNTLQLKEALTSNNLSWSRHPDTEKYKLFAPATFNMGSSVSHIDQNTYSNTPNSLMTPSTSPGKVERDAGIALDMMYDMGWDMTYLLHEPEVGQEDLNEDFIVNVDVISDSEITENSLKLVYSTDRFVSDIREEALTLVQGNQYSAPLPATGDNVIYTYYLTSGNTRGVQFTNPGQAPNNFFSYRISSDDEAPSIAHRSQRTVNNVDPSVTITATITDAYLGVDSAYIAWDVNGIPQANVTMQPQVEFGGTLSSTIYEGVLTYPNGSLNKEDKINYRIFAIDKSKSRNTAVQPAASSFTLSVIEIALPVTSYVNNFNTDSEDFEGQLMRTSTGGFSNGALHSAHPYPNAGDGNFLNFIAELQIPIIIQEENPLIEFNEIAIVEPGDPGSVFGQDEFWDYVIVEGKRSGSDNWIPFLDGYDASEQSTWLSAYNSQSQGTPAMFAPRVIDMTANGAFQAGEIIFVRFRLFSDPFAVGWGWVIDDLKIQELSTAVNDFVIQENINIHPNPTSDYIEITMDLLQSAKDLQFSVLDANGHTLLQKKASQQGLNIRERISIEHLPKGVYLLQCIFSKNDITVKKFIKH